MRIMKIPTTVLLSAVLVVTSLTTMAMPTLNANITNFPVDEKGNLKTIAAQSSRIVLVFNESLTIPSSISNYVYLTSFNTSEFKVAYIMAKAEGSWQVGATIHIWYFDSNFGVQTPGCYLRLDTGSETYKPDWGTGTSAGYAIHSISTDLYLQVYNSNIGFDGLLTIVVYLSNQS